MPSAGRRTRATLCLLLAGALAAAQDYDPDRLVTRGQIDVDARSQSYIIRHLPPSSFPDLPLAVNGELTERGCLIPQTYEAHRPENVIHGSFQRPGSSDWAVLCSAEGTVSLLVFFGATPARPEVLATALETSRLQAHDSTVTLGFNWGIDAASPETVREAQIGLSPRPARLDHDAVSDSVIDHKTVYHYFTKSAWTLAEASDNLR
ncbi:MAG TPA: hypothetical protein VG267_03685 [Terracidiphilus sp.]|jgi:hypothetical protein|nr:hypothetical protein [Terracidiphilus sp.]